MEMVLVMLKTATRNVDIRIEKSILIKYVTERPEVSKSIQAYYFITGLITGLQLILHLIRIMGQYSFYYGNCKSVLHLREHIRASSNTKAIVKHAHRTQRLSLNGQCVTITYSAHVISGLSNIHVCIISQFSYGYKDKVFF